MPRPVPTRVLHFTHLDHLPGVVAHGLLSDTTAQARGLPTSEVGNREIKERRRRRPVPVPPGGTVADYVPFYFAPRSPMMYAIDRGNVPEYAGGIDPLVYLVTTIERLQETGCVVLTTDRNAVLGLAAFRHGLDGLDASVDWQLMEATWWNNTVQEPDRVERGWRSAWFTRLCLGRRSPRSMSGRTLARPRSRRCSDRGSRPVRSSLRQTGTTRSSRNGGSDGSRSAREPPRS
jgi:ssDNA thymidine ADP-ribosyltransferase, DarT